MNKIQSIIFDFDGLLIDSEPLWNESDKILLGRKGFSPTKEIFVRRLGTGQKGTMEIYKKEFDIKEDTEKLIQERLEIFNDLLLKHLKFMEGAEVFLKRAFKETQKLAIVTGGFDRNQLRLILDKLRIAHYFSVLVDRDSVKRGKPNPDGFLLASDKLKINPSFCLVLEDAPSGIVAAKRAGMIAFGVNKNSEVRNRLKEAGADKVFASLLEVEI